MKKSDFKQPVKCLTCNNTETELHELIFGRGVKQISIRYHLQAFICHECHEIAQHNTAANKDLFVILGLDYYELRRIVKNTAEKNWTDWERQFVIEQGEKVLKYYEKYR